MSGKFSLPIVEVELRSLVNDREAYNLLNGADNKRNVTIVRSFYDTSNFSLACRGFILMEQEGGFQLKTPALEIQNGGTLDTTQYRCITKPSDILDELHLPTEGLIKETIISHGFKPFAEGLVIKRNTYSYGDDFYVAVDDVIKSGDNKVFVMGKVKIVTDIDCPGDLENAKEKLKLFFHNQSVPVRSSTRPLAFELAKATGNREMLKALYSSRIISMSEVNYRGF